jgi:hypothetical protein
MPYGPRRRLRQGIPHDVTRQTPIVLRAEAGECAEATSAATDLGSSLRPHSRHPYAHLSLEELTELARDMLDDGYDTVWLKAVPHLNVETRWAKPEYL